MPKIKTNRTAYKKLKPNAKGKKLKRAQAYMSHNTAKKSPKRARQLRGKEWVDSANEKGAYRMLPYHMKKH